MLTDGIVQRTIRIANRNLLIFGLLGLGIVFTVLMIGIGTSYLSEVFGGPFAVDKKTLIQAESAADLPHQYVTVTGDETLYTGFDLVSTSSRSRTETITASYVALVVNDRLLLVETTGDLEAMTFTGTITPITWELQTEVIDSVVNEVPEVEGLFLPYMLTTTHNFRMPAYVGAAVGTVLLGLSGWNLLRAFKRRADPMQHPIMRGLAYFGEPDQIAQKIDFEADRPHNQVGTVRLLNNWLLVVNGGHLQATKFIDMVWIYMKVTQHRTNGIRTGKTYQALLYDRHGQIFTISGREALVIQTLEAVQQHAPWALGGYNNQLMHLWKQQRAQMIAEVDRRIAIVQGASAGTTERATASTGVSF